MSVPFHSQLEPFEEHQSPSPTREHTTNPWETALKTSPTKRNEPPSPVQTINSLHRQLSGDPENPPPAWKRRSSITSNRTPSTRSPNKSIDLTPPPRTHHSLAMTTARPAIPNGVFLHESPNTSSTSLDDPTLTLPQPPFRRRKGGSNRSSIVSNADLSSLTSEELWSMEHEADVSNPHTKSSERPLDTVKRMSGRIDSSSAFRGGLPNEVIWPTAAPGEEAYQPPVKSRSVTSMASLRAVSRRGSRLGPSRQPSMDLTQLTPAKSTDKSNPASPSDFAPREPVFISSNNSSSTSLASHLQASNKSINGRPPSVYYSRDFLSSLAPREGGYAIAATMGNGLGAVGSMTVDSERRRGSAHPEERPRPSSRAPLSRSSGMGRWSLDGGENFNRPYTSNSTNTTSTTLSAKGTSTSGNSPPPDDDASGRAVSLPEGASPAVNPAARGVLETSPPVLQTAAPVNPSPLSRQTTVAELPNLAENVSPVQTPAEQLDDPHSTPKPNGDSQTTPKASTSAAVPIALAKSTPTKTASPLQPKKSKKDLAKEAKAAAKQAKADQKAAAAKLNMEKAKAAREAALKREADKQAEKRRREEEKRKEKEEKARLKAEKKKAKTSVASRQASVVPGSTTPAATPAKSTPASTTPSTPQVNAAVPFPRTSSKNAVVQSETPRKTAVSIPPSTPATSAVPAAPAAPAQPSQASQATATVGPSRTPTRRLGVFGTIKKRLSVLGDLRGEDGATPRATRNGSTSVPAVPAVPTTPAVKAALPAELPPRSSSRATEVSASDLPPRSTSRVGEAKLNLSESTTPQSFHSATMAALDSVGQPEQTEQAAEASTAAVAQAPASPLTKTISRDRVSSSPVSQRSVRGPRPMPRSSLDASRDRRGSIGTQASEPQAALDDNATGSGLDVVTPATSAESSMFSQHLTANGERALADVSTPFTSEAGDSAAGSEKDSSETVAATTQGSQTKASPAVPVTTVVPVSLGAAVSAH